MFAYILASFNPGSERNALDALSELPEIKDVNLIFGEWDLIMKVQVESPAELEKFVIEQIRSIPGNKLTSTMIVAR